ncbi:immunoglobulin-like domain-containing protein [Gorillibacterium timonense]|uniref:immunoglobulin-like domain-containing protein n=1 Tax=Gorillibacterium timonense TaxID=1689269 RepID=UPI00071DB32A|nr:immunoglobulin-like domain-containing protein [Gorillibacterium timonense]
MISKKTLTLITASALILGAIAPAATMAQGKSTPPGQEKNGKAVGSDRSRQVLDNFVQQWKKNQPNKKAKKTDASRVAEAKAALAIDFGGKDTVASVTTSLDKLPQTGKQGVKITWQSSYPDMLTNEGKLIKRPAAGTGDVKVVLIAVLSYGTAQDYKVFELTVKADISDAQKVALDKAALKLDYAKGDSASSVTKPIGLPTKGANGSKITWYSSNPSVISNDGKTVNRPGPDANGTVLLTAIITSGSISDTLSFTVTVKPVLSEAQKVAADKAALTIGFSGTDTAASVTRELKLPSQGENGSKILWLSSNTALIPNGGKKVNRPAVGTGDQAVVLTAILYNDMASESKTFTVVVKQKN